MVSSKLGQGLTFTGKLKPAQADVVELVATGDGWGQINAPPRFGKTVTMAAITARLRTKTLILAHQIDLCRQALKTFQDPAFTNIAELESIHGGPLVGIVEKWDEIDKYDVCIMVYQKFITPGGQKKLAEIKDLFGLVMVDEVHRASATRYTEVHTAFSAKYKHGFSGTTETKSKSHKINIFTIGPVITRAESQKVPCRVQVLFTGIKVPFSMTSPKMFSYFLNFLSTNDFRNNMIHDLFMSYVKQGHIIIAVTDREQQAVQLVDRLCAAGVSAEGFHRSRFKRKKEREECLERARRGEIKVLVAIRSMTLGLDIPRVTTFFNLLPTANKENYYQELSRARTATPWKNICHVVDLIDDHPVAEACYKSRKAVYTAENCEIVGDEFIGQRNRGY